MSKILLLDIADYNRFTICVNQRYLWETSFLVSKMLLLFAPCSLLPALCPLPPWEIII
jgi:hypothetical protein